MNDQSQVLLRAIKGPVIMITIGVLFAADRFSNFHFHETWPILLIVIGLIFYYFDQLMRISTNSRGSRRP